MSAWDKLNDLYNDSLAKGRDSLDTNIAEAKLKTQLYGKMLSNQASGIGEVLDFMDRPLNSTQGMATEFSQSLQRGESPLDAFSAGQKGAVSGLLQEKDYSYLEAIPPEWQAEYPKTSAAVGLGADILLDPTLVAGGALFKLGRTGVNAIKNVGSRGFVSSSFPNYLDNFYGLPEEAFKNTSTFDKIIGEALALGGVKGASTTKEGTALVAKAKGFIKGAAQGMKNVGSNLVSPEARALWAEQGLNQSAIKIIEDRLSGSLTEAGFDLTSNEGKKAMAQAQFHILALVRAGKKDAIPEALKRIADVSFMGGYLPYNKQAYKTVIKENSRIVNKDTGRKLNVPDKVLDQALGHISNAWDLPLDNPLVTLTVKRAQGSGGAHVTDAAFKNPANKEIKNAFVFLDEKGEKTTNEALFNYFKKRLSAKSTKGEEVKTAAQKRFKLLTQSAEDAKENGIWIQSSGRSVSYLEGGINFMTHIDQKGRATTFVSDEQNFLEKVPVIRHVIEGKMGDQPVRSLTVSEPIVVDLIKKEPIKINSGIRPEWSMVDPKKPRTERVAQNEDFGRLLTAKSSDEMLKAMKTQMLGEGLLATNTAQKITSDDN